MPRDLIVLGILEQQNVGPATAPMDGLLGVVAPKQLPGKLARRRRTALVPLADFQAIRLEEELVAAWGSFPVCPQRAIQSAPALQRRSSIMLLAAQTRSLVPITIMAPDTPSLALRITFMSPVPLVPLA